MSVALTARDVSYARNISTTTWRLGLRHTTPNRASERARACEGRRSRARMPNFGIARVKSRGRIVDPYRFDRRVGRVDVKSIDRVYAYAGSQNGDIEIRGARKGNSKTRNEMYR